MSSVLMTVTKGARSGDGRANLRYSPDVTTIYNPGELEEIKRKIRVLSAQNRDDNICPPTPITIIAPDQKRFRVEAYLQRAKSPLLRLRFKSKMDAEDRYDSQPLLKRFSVGDVLKLDKVGEREFRIAAVNDKPVANALVVEPDLVEDDSSEVARIRSAKNLTHTEKEILLQARVGQGRFRNDLINEWDSCAITGEKARVLLRAAHIKPWKISTNEERLDPNNGLLLLVNLDVAFENGFISFDDAGGILISEKFSKEQQARLAISSDMRLRMPPTDKRRAYIRYHRGHKFNK